MPDLPGQDSNSVKRYTKAAISPATRRALAAIANLEMDHVLAEVLGGSHEPSNIVLACRSCNRRKGTLAWTVT